MCLLHACFLIQSIFYNTSCAFIFQLRLDFQSFSISGPSTNTASVTKRLLNSGVVAPAGAVKVSQFTQCLTDTFSVSNSDGPNPPTICGINTGEHSMLH